MTTITIIISWWVGYIWVIDQFFMVNRQIELELIDFIQQREISPLTLLCMRNTSVAMKSSYLVLYILNALVFA